MQPAGARRGTVKGGRSGASLRVSVPINGGRDLADEVEMPDPETGARVVVLRNRTGSVVERLALAGQISADQLAWAVELRDAWEAAGLEIVGNQTQSWHGGAGSSRRPAVRDEAAWRRYAAGLAGLARLERQCLVAVVVHGESVERHGIACLRRALDMLGAVWGYR